jgi:serine/threonine protein kinase
MGELNIGPKLYLGGLVSSMVQKRMLGLNINTNIDLKRLTKQSHEFLGILLDNLHQKDKNIGILVMEPIEGGTFIEKCRNRTNIRGPQGQQCDKVCEKIDEMHSNNIIHNDIHQNNLLFNEAGEPRIIDFGESIDLTDGYEGFIEIEGHKYDTDSYIKQCYRVRNYYSNFVNQFMNQIPRDNIVVIKNNPKLANYDPKKDYNFGLILTNLATMNDNIKRFVEANRDIINKLIPYYGLHYKGELRMINPNSFIPYFMYSPVCH